MSLAFVLASLGGAGAGACLGAIHLMFLQRSVDALARTQRVSPLAWIGGYAARLALVTGGFAALFVFAGPVAGLASVLGYAGLRAVRLGRTGASGRTP